MQTRPRPRDDSALRREATCWLGYTAIGIAFNLLGPILPALRGELHAGYGALALLFVTSSAGSALANLLGNRLLDRVGYRSLLAAAGAVFGVALLAMAAVHVLVLWAAGTAVGGFAGSAIDIAGARYIAESRTDGVSGALNLLNVFYGVGGLLAPLAVAILALAHRHVLWAYPFGAVLMLALGATAAATMGRARPPRSGESSAAAAWRWAFGRPALVRLGVVIALYAGCEVAFAGWVASYAHESDHLTIARAAAYPLLFWLALTVGRSLAAERSRRWSERRLLAVGVGLSLIGGAACLVVPGALGLGAAVLLVGAGFGPIFPTVYALAAQDAPDHHSEAYGLLFAASSVGTLTLPWLAGQLFARAGGAAGLAVPVAGAFAMAAVLVVALAHRRGPGAQATGLN